jgi:SAM-dependent methyltransferase
MSEASAMPAGVPRLRPNNLYLIEWMRRANHEGFRALDFGCGDGALVFNARNEGVDAYGAETYYDGARPEDLELVRRFDPTTTIVRAIVNGRLPFPDEWFDLIVANQVFEHLHDLRGTARELLRVLRPGGAVLSLFPTIGVVREGHLAVPLAHRLHKGSVRRRYYRLARNLSKRARRVDWGPGEEGVDKALSFLDHHVCYRTLGQFKDVFGSMFSVRFIEDDWLAYRKPAFRRLRGLPCMKLASAVFCRLAAGTVMLATKAPAPHKPGISDRSISVSLAPLAGQEVIASE